MNHLTDFWEKYDHAYWQTEGKTRCPACGKLLKKLDEVTALKKFMALKTSERYQYELHKDCVFIEALNKEEN